MGRQILGVRLTDVIRALGAAWGVILFLLGLANSFSIGGPNFIAGMVELVFGFLMVLPITIMAYWRPRVAAASLLIAFIVLECAVFTSDGLRVGSLVGLIIGLPNTALIWGYIYGASVRSKSQRINSSVVPRV